MKTINNLFDKIADKDNIYAAIFNAAKNRKDKRYIKRALKNSDKISKTLSEKLKSGRWRPNKIHNVKVINDGVTMKKREIVCPKFVNELVVHHAIFQVCKPYFVRRFYKYSCASIPNRGMEYTLKHIRRAINSNNNTKYFTVIDIKNFYNSVKPSTVFRCLRRIIRDKRALILFARILRANKVRKPNGEIKRSGIPIGFYSSQWFANILLTPLDNLIKASKIKHYFRYNDDMLLFCSNKRKLKKVINAVSDYLKSIGLRVKRNPQIHMFSNVKITFAGAVISPEKIVIRDKVFLRACRSARRISDKSRITVYDARKMLSYSAKFNHYDCYDAYHTHIEKYIKRKACRKIVSLHDRKKGAAKCGISLNQPKDH